MDDEAIWFEPKSYGYGAGMPVRRQGWALLGGFILTVFALGRAIAARHPLLYCVLLTLLTVVFLIVCARHTRGGWRWRWGGH